MSKNIEMQELTSNGYETLFPKTNVDQVVGIERCEWQVGDIRETVRTDLDEKWLLCNGQAANPVQYPNLKSFLPIKWVGAEFPSNSYFMQNCIYQDGLWVGVRVGTIGGKYYPMVFTTTDPTKGAWNSKQISTRTGRWNAVKIVYQNGTWAACFNQGSSYSEWQIYIYSTNDIDGIWTEEQIGYAYKKAYDFGYYNNQWVVSGEERPMGDSYPILFSSEKIAQRTAWNNIRLNFTGAGGTHNGEARLIGYANGRWVCGLNDVQGGQDMMKIISSTDLQGEWTYWSPVISSVTLHGTPLSLAYYDRWWVYTFSINYFRGAPDGIYVGFSTDGYSWGLRRVGSAYRGRIDYITYRNGEWIGCGQAQMASGSTATGIIVRASTPNGTWNIEETGINVTYSYLEYDNSNILFLRDDNKMYTQFPVVPTLAENEAHFYIKAKD